MNDICILDRHDTKGSAVNPRLCLTSSPFDRHLDHSGPHARILGMPVDVVIGSGTAGTHIANRLLDQGRSVRVIDFNDPSKHSEKFSGPSEKLELVRGDATNPKSVAQGLSGDVENVVLAFQGHNWNSAGKVDHGVRSEPACVPKGAGITAWGV